MIEAVMLVGLGFLAAALLALLVLPAIQRRANRLAKLRAERQFPMSIAEIQAERDHLRAEFALRQREIERRADEALESRRGALEEVGRRDGEIARLKTDLVDRDARIVMLEANLADARAEISDLRTSLTSEQAAHARSREELAIALATITQREREIGQLSVVRADLAAELTRTAAALEQARDDGRALETELTQLKADLAAERDAHGQIRSEHLALVEAHQDAVAASRTLSAEHGILRSRMELTSAALEDARRHGAELETWAERAATEIEELKAALHTTEGRLSERSLALAELQTTRGLVDIRLEAATTERDQLRDELRVLGLEKARALAEARSELLARDARILGLENQLADARTQGAAARSERADAQQELAALRRRLDEAELVREAMKSATSTAVPQVLLPGAAPANDGEISEEAMLAVIARANRAFIEAHGEPDDVVPPAEDDDPLPEPPPRQVRAGLREAGVGRPQRIEAAE